MNYRVFLTRDTRHLAGISSNSFFFKSCDLSHFSC